MNSRRLPPLSDAQHAKVKQLRDRHGHDARISVIRKGQRWGHICVSVSDPAGVWRLWYDPAATLMSRVFEPKLAESLFDYGQDDKSPAGPFTEL